MNARFHVKKFIPYLVLIAFLLFAFLVYLDSYFKSSMNSISSSPGVCILEEGKPVKESVSFMSSNVEGVAIQFATFGKKCTGQIIFSLIDAEKGEALIHDKIMMEEIADNTFAQFDIKGKDLIDTEEEYILQINAEYNDNNPIAVWTGESDNFVLIGDEKTENRSISYRISYNMKKLKLRLFICVLFGMLCIALLGALKNRRIVAVVTVSIASLGYFLVFPPGKIPDEIHHFMRSFEISCGNLVSRHSETDGEGGNYLPIAMKHYDDPDAEINWDETEWMNFSNISIYSPTNYFPQAIAIRIARQFTDNVQRLFYAGRIGGCLFWLICSAVAIMLIPFGWRPLSVLLLFPITLQEGISLAADGFTNGISVLLIAFIMRIAFRRQKIKKREIIFLGILSVLLSLSKIVYVVLILLVFIIPKEAFETKKGNLAFKIAIPVTAFLINFLWLWFATSYLTVPMVSDADSGRQIMNILTNPLAYGAVMVRTIFDKIYFWVDSLIDTLGYYDISVNNVVLFGSIIIYSIEVSNLSAKMDQIHWTMFLFPALVLIGGFGLICTSEYLTWTKVGNNVIEGIQGRYYVPLLPVLNIIVALCNGRRANENKLVYLDKNEEVKGVNIFLIMYFLDAIAIVAVISKYVSVFI